MTQDFEILISTKPLQRLLWADPQRRREVQAAGVNLIPSNFYSNIPSLAELDQSFEYTEAAAPYLDAVIFDDQAMLMELASLVPLTEDFEPITDSDENTCREYFWNNTQFSYSDAMAYYAYLRKSKPAKVLEIGSGFSTLIALEALRRNGSGQVVCIEPYPRPFIAALAEEGQLELIQQPVQALSPAYIDGLLSDGDVLFIDSTHTVKSGSDCMHIYLRVIPRLTKHLLVHVHDIFLPFGMPKDWAVNLHIYWTEQHLLLALITDNSRFKLLYGSAYHEHFNKAELDKLMYGRRQCGGGSVWFDYQPRQVEVG
jgi:hypothetical protein